MHIKEIRVSTIDRKYECASIPFDVNSKNEKSHNKKRQLEIFPAHQLHSILGIGYSFEHTSCANLLLLSPSDRQRALELMIDPVKGAGMNLWRLCIGTPDFTGTPWYSYCDTAPLEGLSSEELVNYIEDNFSLGLDQDLIIPIVKQAQNINPNLIFFASPWSPPGWMKDTKNMCGGRLLPQYRAAYARYFIKYLQAYETLGISILAVTIQNEPYHNVKTMPTCFWTGEQERDFIRDFLGPELKRAGLSTEIWCYDHNWDDIPFRPSHYPHKILQDQEAAKYVKGIGFHHYSALGWSNPKLMLKHRKRTTVPFYFTEGSLFGLWGAMRLSRYLKFGARSYSGWVPMIDTEGHPNNGPFHATNTILQRKVPGNTIQINFDYYMFCHFSKFIQTGAIVLDSMHSRMRGIETLCVKNPTGEIISIITNKSKKSRKLEIKINEGIFSIELQANSITTIRFF
jgi:O-glycosyl hydrolase